MERFVCAVMLWTKVGAALQSCHHANDHPDVRRDDLLLAEGTHIRETPYYVLKERQGNPKSSTHLARFILDI